MDHRLIQARMVVFVSGEFADTGNHLGWRQLAQGEYEEHFSEYRAHLSFLEDSDNMQEIGAILRKEMDRAIA